MREEFMDAAAGEAIGANSAAESAAYQKDLAGASEEERRLDGEIRETVARMAAASPFMEAPAKLRGRILQETAPATFRMEDYVKATKENGRFYKWGFYAAMLFLSAGAYYNLAMQKQVQAYAERQKSVEQAVVDMVNPQAMPITFKVQGKTAGKGYANAQTKTAVVVFPEGMIPGGQSPQLSLNKTAFKTVYVQVPHEAFPDVTPKQISETAMAIEKLEPDQSASPAFTATMKP